MGAVSQLVVPGGTYTQIPRLNRGKHCSSVCYCSKHGIIENCSAMPCIGKAHCSVLGREIQHQSTYRGNCTICFCYSDVLRCARTCPNDVSSNAGIILGPLCSCPLHYSPVCGLNGKTYTNPCVARCAGLKDGQFKTGSCSDLDPCEENTCGGNKKRCVPRRQVCLSLKKRCNQYICVNKDNCEDKPSSPVCDTDNDEHPNSCLLLAKKKTLAYHGKCLAKCQRKGKVCGHDGEEYSSECAAWAMKMSIDYRGPCVRRKNEAGASSCSEVNCQPLPSEHCKGIIPPNSCCPICGAALKLVYDQRLIDHVINAIQSIEPATVSKVAQKLQEHIKTTECDVSTYLDEDSSIVALISPNIPQPSQLQIEACVQEAMKLHSLVEQRSPTLVTEFPLSAFIGSFMIEPFTVQTDGSSAIHVNVIVQVVCIVGLLWTSLHNRIT